jgi:hypothetical protein
MMDRVNARKPVLWGLLESERMFVDLMADPGARALFIEDRELYLADFELSQAEFDQIMEMDAAKMMADVSRALGIA